MVIYFIFLLDNVRLFLSVILFTFYGNLFYFLLDKFMLLRIILSINTYVKSKIFQELCRGGWEGMVEWVDALALEVFPIFHVCDHWQCQCSSIVLFKSLRKLFKCCHRLKYSNATASVRIVWTIKEHNIDAYVILIFLFILHIWNDIILIFY